VLGFFDLRLLGPAAFIDVDNLSIVDARGRQLLANGGFSEGMSQWFFSSRHDFLSWHVDSLFLEVLIDQGVVGLSLLLALLAMAFANLLRGPGGDHVLAPYLLSALLACLVVGVFSSLLDMPRSAFLFYLLLSCALFLNRRAFPGLLKAPSASFDTH
jgi:O-antigen ligase